MAETRVYVGNLSWDVSSDELKEHMQQAGDVTSAEVMEESSGRSKGCGLVTYSTEEEAKKACEQLSDSDLKGRQIFVREDRGKGGGKGDKGGDKGGDVVSGCRVYVGSLSWDATSKDLEEHFAACGEVTLAEVVSDGDRSKGFGFVEFKTSAQAQAAVDELQEVEICGRKIFVREDRGKKGKGDSKGYDRKGDSKGYGGKGKSYGEKGDRKGKGKGYGDADRGGKGGDPGCKVFVGNLAFAVSWQDLKDHCRDAGDVVRAEVMTAGGAPKGRSKGCGVVEFATPGEAQKAVDQLTDTELSGRAIFVREYRP